MHTNSLPMWELKTFNQLKDNLTRGDIADLVQLLGRNSGKKLHLDHYLTKPELRNRIPKHQILDRLVRFDKWQFQPIIDERSELKMARNIILGVR